MGLLGRWTLVLLTLVPTAAPAATQAAGEAQPQALAERLDRDRRLSFGGDSRTRALRALENEALSTRRFAVALLTLGCAQAREEIERLEGHARDAEQDLEVRRAAVLGLGEAGFHGVAPLMRLAAQENPGLDIHIAVALVRTGSPRASAFVLQKAYDPESSFVDAARFCAEYARSGRPPSPSPAFDLLLDLRWEAAREYGFVSNRRWREVAFEALLNDADFRNRTVLIASIEPDSPPVRDHLYQVVLEGESPSRLRAAVLAMPVTLARMIEEGTWQPRGEEWEVLFSEIEDRHREEEAVDLLWLGLKELAQRHRAGVMLLRAGQLPSKEWLADALEQAGQDGAIEIVTAMGEGGEPERLDDVLGFVSDASSNELEFAALVAAARLGHEPSLLRVRELIQGEPGVERDAVLTALTAAAEDRRFQPFLVEALSRGETLPEVRFQIELALALAGRLRTRHELSAWLSKDVRSFYQRQVVRALGPRADRAEFEAMQELFPVEKDVELNVELALMLIRYRDPWGIRLLQATLWESPFHQSVLAGGLLVRTGGLQTLIAELDSPPATATARDLRRVGFAIGEWGGFPAVEALSRRRGPEDPAMQGAFLGALSVRTQ